MTRQNCSHGYLSSPPSSSSISSSSTCLTRPAHEHTSSSHFIIILFHHYPSSSSFIITLLPHYPFEGISRYVHVFHFSRIWNFSGLLSHLALDIFWTSSTLELDSSFPGFGSGSHFTSLDQIVSSLPPFSLISDNIAASHWLFASLN